MATRQYIGPRYVIKVYENSLDPNSAEWENVAFEPLTMVTYQNSSYLSKKQVPANVGNPVTATAYWVCTGYYNGQISTLQTAVAAINTKIGDLDNLPTTDKDSIVDAIIELSSDITALTKGGDCIIIAASYGVTPSASDNCVVKLKALINYMYDNIYDNSVGGAAFFDGSYLSALQGIESNVVSPAHVKDIIIIGHGNDQGQSDNDILTGLINFSAYCHTHYPNSKIMIAPVSTDTRAANTALKYNVFNLEINTMADHGITMMDDLLHILALNYPLYVSADFVHPTTYGSTLIANAIYNKLVTGSFFKTEKLQRLAADMVLSSDFALASGYWAQENVQCTPNDISFYLSCAVTITGASLQIPVTVGTQKLMVASPLLKGLSGSDYYPYRNLTGVIVDNANNTQYAIRLNIVEDSGVYYYTITSNIGTSITLTSGHVYSIRVMDTTPFYLN